EVFHRHEPRRHHVPDRGPEAGRDRRRAEGGKPMKSELTRLRLAALPFVALLFVLALMTSGARAQDTGSAPAPQETPPPPAAPRTVNVPKPVERTLRNGLRVIVIEHHETPLVVAQLMLKSGGEVDPPLFN